jgi:hypothetical protein
VRSSVAKRLEDSAVQISVLRLCGETDFANRMESVALKTNGFIQTLSVCTAERIDIREIYEDRLSYVSSRMATERCSPSMREMIESRRTFFENQMQIAEMPNIEEVIFDKLQIKIDTEGNLSDK